MLYFYIFIHVLYVSTVSILIWNTRKNSDANKLYLRISTTGLLKRVFTNNLFFHNTHVIFGLWIQLYVTWCAVRILKNLDLVATDTIFGIFTISTILFLFLIKRILILTVANKSVLYL